MSMGTKNDTFSRYVLYQSISKGPKLVHGKLQLPCSIPLDLAGIIDTQMEMQYYKEI